MVALLGGGADRLRAAAAAFAALGASAAASTAFAAFSFVASCGAQPRSSPWGAGPPAHQRAPCVGPLRQAATVRAATLRAKTRARRTRAVAHALACQSLYGEMA